MTLILSSIVSAAARGVRWWIYYLALEPLARRYFPVMMTSWNRVVAGRFRDPMIGRGILIGAAVGVWYALPVLLIEGTSDPSPNPVNMSGFRFLLSQFMIVMQTAAGGSLFWAFVFVIFSLAVRKTWLAILVFIAIITPTIYFSIPERGFGLAIGLLVYLGIISTLLSRFGVITSISFVFCVRLMVHIPISFDFSGPDFPGTMFAVVTVTAWACYGFWTSLGRRVFSVTNS